MTMGMVKSVVSIDEDGELDGERGRIACRSGVPFTMSGGGGKV